MTNNELILKLNTDGVLTHNEFKKLIETSNADDLSYANQLAREISLNNFGNKVYIRGLIEFTNICKNDCFYCGLRCSNSNADRYRLSENEILQCCETGYKLGFRTFVLQGGEDPKFTDEKICALVEKIKKLFPDCAVTLSVGERERSSYEMFFKSGADRFLLRHETANNNHYAKLHPDDMSLENRKKCLYMLKEIGFQTGCGFMVGSPYQTSDTIAEDMLFIHELKPQMVGIGPFIPHKDTPFRDKQQGSFELTLFLLSLVRIMLKNVLLPSTTALGTIHPNGREMGILSGANVVMPNLSPVDVRSKYMLYNNKISTGEEAAECTEQLKKKMESIGYTVTVDRGDWKEI